MNPAEAAEHLDLLFREHRGMVRNYLNRMCRNSHLADDLTSETFERALRALSRPEARPHANPANWLRAIARNLLIDHYRRAASRYEIPDAADEEIAGVAPSADAALLASEEIREVARLLDALTPGQREAIVLSTLNGYTTPETASIMGRSPQAVRSLRHKALRRLSEQHLEAVSA